MTFDEWRAKTQIYELNPERHKMEICHSCLYNAKAAWNYSQQQTITRVLEILDHDSAFSHIYCGEPYQSYNNFCKIIEDIKKEFAVE